MRKQLKLVAFATAMLVVGMANAQQKTGRIDQKDNDRGNHRAGADRVVRVIDNKGTVKYLQVSNGITTLTNRTKGGVLTTWQLGGTLSTNTTIGFGTGTASPSFELDGKKFYLENIGTVTSTAGVASGKAATRTTDESKRKDGTISTNYTGWTFLVRDEATGTVKKMLATDALKVTSAQTEFTIATTNSETTVDGVTAVRGGNVSNTVIANTTQNNTAGSGVALDFMTDYTKVSVYRNGAKLRANLDYKVISYSANKIAKVYLVENKTNPDTNMNYWELYEEDIIEIHYTK